MRADRLLKLADFLETVPREAFNISLWQSSPATKPEGNAPGSCGFAGCAVGWAAHQAMFRGFGLTLAKNRMPDGSKAYQPYYRKPGAAKGVKGDRAVTELFRIDDNAMMHLFFPHTYPHWTATPKQVAKRIRKFVKDNSTGAGK